MFYKYTISFQVYEFINKPGSQFWVNYVFINNSHYNMYTFEFENAFYLFRKSFFLVHLMKSSAPRAAQICYANGSKRFNYRARQLKYRHMKHKLKRI